MASSGHPNQDLINLVKTLFESHKKLEAKHEKLEKEVSVLRQQVTAVEYFRRNNTDSLQDSRFNHDFEPGGAASNFDLGGNTNPISQKHSPRSGPQSLHINTNTDLTTRAKQSPVQLNSDPPRNVQRPHPSQPGRKKLIRFADICVAEKTSALLLQTKEPQESDFIKVLRQCGVEVNPATIAAVLSASRVQRGLEWTRPAGLHTVFVLDISESMNGQGFSLMKTFVATLLSGFESTEKECGLYEYVSLITCGGITGIMQDFTNDYQEVKNKIDRLQTNGRTPLMTALTLALCYLELQGETVVLNAYNIKPRVIVVSDFELSTDQQPFNGTESDGTEDRTQIQNLAYKFGKAQFKPHNYRMVGVPVGKCNMSVAKEFAKSCGGSIISNQADIENVKFFYPQQIAAKCALHNFDSIMEEGKEMDIISLVQKSTSSVHLNKSHESAVMKIVEEELQEDNDGGEFVNDIENDARLSSSQTSPHGESYSQEPHGQECKQVQAESPPVLPEWIPPRHLDNISLEEMFGVPSIGSRVQRGKNWKSNNDDNNGPGTIVGHKQKGIAYVLWDNEHFGEYRYGLDGLHEVQQTTNVRHVAPGQIEIGCNIVRGPDWDRGEEDGGIGTVGVVVRKLRGRFVQVRWPSRVVETYRFGANNKWDIKITDVETQQEVTPPRSAAQATVPTSTNTSQTEVLPSTNTSYDAFLASTHTAVDTSQQQNPSNVPLKPWWSWKDGSNQWIPFLDEDVKRLELKLSGGQTNCLLQYRNKRVKVFINELQCEIDGRKFEIKREMLKQEEIESLRSIVDCLPPMD